MFAQLKPAMFLLCSLVIAAAACKQKADPTGGPLPVPGAHQNMPANIIRPALDKSPMDMIYFPNDYPVLKMSGKVNGPPIARVIYSRPGKDGRIIFGNLVKYSEHWRLGANEATEIEFFRDVTILGKAVKKGRYVLYCVPYPDKWTLILNNDLFVWGLHIHTSEDMMSFEVPAVVSDTIYESFTMQFDEKPGGMALTMAWDNVQAALPISL